MELSMYGKQNTNHKEEILNERITKKEWFSSRCRYEVLLDLNEEQILQMVPVVPILVAKESMLISIV